MKIAVIGCAGRMGRINMRAVLDAGLDLVAGVETPGHAALGTDLGTLAGTAALGRAVTADAAAAIRGADAAIEFSSPAATVAHAEIAAEAGCVHVTGTTGLDADQEAALARAGERTPIVYAPNMSRGVTLLMELVETVARALGDEFDIEIVEMHHNRKVDAPSGTALGLGRAAARGRGVALDDVAERGRDGLTGAREAGRIGFAALRGGDVVGDHTVHFAGPGERLELTHRAGDRAIYGRGAVEAARWARARPPGLYRMAEVLGLAR
jgi:4-hydroxy-tetrahydrodipicolinate reductase